ncbi:hypothetical protein [Pseudophaeobacter sp.]|uniref:hypothetical protein n=1 Tax=Pseudophaeobacter sp. TaxID=1971739 RepID=UPI004059342D
MKTGLWAVVISAGLVISALPAFAGSQTYHCKFESSGNLDARPWKADLDDVLVEIDEDQRTVRVFNKYVGVNSAQPVAARIKDMRNGNRRLKWEVSGLPGTRTEMSDVDGSVSVTDVKVTVSFRMEFSKNFETVGYQTRLPGDWWSRKSKGRCRPLPGKIVRYIKS